MSHPPESAGRPAGPPPGDGDGGDLVPGAPSDSVVAVIRELKLSGLNNLEDLIRESIQASQFSVRGHGAVTANRLTGGHWTFVSEHYVYEGETVATTQMMW